MAKFLGTAVIILLIAFVSYVSTRPAQFFYERSGIIKAAPAEIFPYITDFKKGQEWSPYEKVDPNMKRKYSGGDAQVGSVMEFDGNNEVGSGKLEILKIVPNESVEIKLTMTKPFAGDNLVTYKLTPEAEGTRFSWSMSGESGFLGKLISVLIDCEKMVGDQFSEGINNLKTLIESQTK